MSDDEGISPTEVILAVGVFILMLGVGASCDIKLLRRLLKSRRAQLAAGVGVLCQFGVMPLIAYLLSRVFGVEGYTALGFVLSGCMPGGSASNVLTVWTRGVLELSVCMTIISNVLALGLTPLCLYAYGHAIGVESALAFKQISTALAFLVGPLGTGAALTYYWPNLKERIEQGLGTFAMIIFLLVLVLVCIDYPEVFKTVSYETIVPALIYFPIAASVSYVIAKYMCRFPPCVCRTITIETGLQNLALAFAIGELSVRSTQDRVDLIPFPLFYSLFMYFWIGLLLPMFRYQHHYNTTHDIEDMDPDLFGLDEDKDDARHRVDTEELSTISKTAHGGEDVVDVEMNDDISV